MICYTARKARSELLGLAFLLKKVLHLVCYGLSLIMIRTRGRFQYAAVFRDSPRTVQKTVIAGSIEAAVQYRRRFPSPVEVFWSSRRRRLSSVERAVCAGS